MFEWYSLQKDMKDLSEESSLPERMVGGLADGPEDTGSAIQSQLAQPVLERPEQELPVLVCVPCLAQALLLAIKEKLELKGKADAQLGREWAVAHEHGLQGRNHLQGQFQGRKQSPYSVFHIFRKARFGRVPDVLCLTATDAVEHQKKCTDSEGTTYWQLHLRSLTAVGGGTKEGLSAFLLQA